MIAPAEGSPCPGRGATVRVTGITFDLPHCWHVPVDSPTEENRNGVWQPAGVPERVCCFCGAKASETHGSHFARLTGL